MSKYPDSLREEEIKLKVAEDWFPKYDTTQILGNVDFCVKLHTEGPMLFETPSLLWAEAKKGSRSNPIESLVQLIITIGKARTFDKCMPPPFLGAFDAKKIAFVPYSEVQDVFYINDFNWNVTPSDHSTREFQMLLARLQGELSGKVLTFDFEQDEPQLRKFIACNFMLGTGKIQKIRITKNNFVPIFNRWLETVKPQIMLNWEVTKQEGFLPADFYLADLLSRENSTIIEKLYVLLRNDHYVYNKVRKLSGSLSFQQADFCPGGLEVYKKFWSIYERPPREDYWDYIIERRDILVPQDVREVRGSFFTPHRWVELSQDYLARTLGEDWQDEYYVWDCCAGTGNLLANLTNAPHIWASTLDQPDVDVMKQIASNRGLNLLEKHIFQFDFLNDYDPEKKLSDNEKLPESLRKVIVDPEERKKLVIYINPPYVEAVNARKMVGTGQHKAGVSETKIKEKFKKELSYAARELFVQFWMRCYREIKGCKIASFATLKTLQGFNFVAFRKVFQVKLESLFLMPAYTFDNVKGKFPIGFHIWDTERTEYFKSILADVYDEKANYIGQKQIYGFEKDRYVIAWLRNYYDKEGNVIGYIRLIGTDIQHNRYISISNALSENDKKEKVYTVITAKNILPVCIYAAIRRIIPDTWLNDRDQYLVPKETWEEDAIFKSDCLVYMLFDSDVRSARGTNHWIPYTETEVNAPDSFESHFMSEFLRGKHRNNAEADLFNAPAAQTNAPLPLSPAAKETLHAGREIWRYYMSQPNPNVNASFYDIREHFQGRDKNGRMNPDSPDEKYTDLLAHLRECLKNLSAQIEPKVYEYGFLLA